MPYLTDDPPIDAHAFDRHVIGLPGMLERVLVGHEQVASGFPDEAAARSAVLLTLSQKEEDVKSWLASPDDGSHHMLRGRSDMGFAGVRRDGMDVSAVLAHTIVVVLAREEHGFSVRTAYPDARMHPEPSDTDLLAPLRHMPSWHVATLDQRWLWALMCDPAVSVPMGSHADGGFVWVPLAQDDASGMMRIGRDQTAGIDAHGDVIWHARQDALSKDACIARILPRSHALMRAAYGLLPVAQDRSWHPAIAAGPRRADTGPHGADVLDAKCKASRKAPRGMRRHARQVEMAREAAHDRKAKQAKKVQKDAARRNRKAKDAGKAADRAPAVVIDHDPNFESQAHEALFVALMSHADLVSESDWRVLTLAVSPSIVVARQADAGRIRRALDWLEGNAAGFDALSGSVESDRPFDVFEGLALEDVCPSSKARALTGRLAREGSWAPLLPESMLDAWARVHGWRPDLFQPPRF